MLPLDLGAQDTSLPTETDFWRKTKPLLIPDEKKKHGLGTRRETRKTKCTKIPHDLGLRSPVKFRKRFRRKVIPLSYHVCVLSVLAVSLSYPHFLTGGFSVGTNHDHDSVLCFTDKNMLEVSFEVQRSSPFHCVSASRILSARMNLKTARGQGGVTLAIDIGPLQETDPNVTLLP